MRGPIGARPLPFTSNQALNGSNLIGGNGRLMGWSIKDGSGSNTIEADGTAAAPVAGATIASVALANGVYAVQWELELSGTISAADADNVQLFIAATSIDKSVNAGVAGTYGPFVTQANVVFGPLTLAAKAIGNATAASSYRVTLKALQMANALCDIKDGGMVIASPSIGPQNSETQWLGGLGVRFDNGLSVQVNQGTISGVLWFALPNHIDERMGD